MPGLDSKRDANEYKPVWQQEVLDEQGRRRFHGAFTGGYSAGYFNTVGSKEGWTPGTFRSSRKNKSEGEDKGRVGTRPEDFMDEEDLEALREGKGALSSTQTYGMEQEQQQRERDPLMDMLGLGQDQRQPQAISALDTASSIQIASSSLGTGLLQRMGWRLGQGLGPRVTFKRRNEMLALAGRDTSTLDKEDEEADKHLWPPPDTQMPVFNTKADAKGLGWRGESRGGGLDEALRKARGEKGREATEAGAKKAGGFGLGALEDDSDGEDEVYASGNQIGESTLARGASSKWLASKDRMVLGGAPAKTSAVVKQSLAQGEVGDDNVWHDGRAMIAGFQVASRTFAKEPWFETPQVPSGWKPDPQTVWARVAAGNSSLKTAGQLSAADRASILGEARLPGPPPLIQDYLSLKDKERLQRGKDVAATPRQKDRVTEPVLPRSESTQEIPSLEPALARSALLGYMPFRSDPEKQDRYRAYLTSQAHPHEKAAAPLRPLGQQTQAQFIMELREFAKSAGIFKPMSIVMASRFQSSASGSSEVPQTNPGLHIPEQKPAMSVEEEEARAEDSKREEEERKGREEMETLTSAQRSARLGLFGKETRNERVWKPSRLLCKRFNVPMPYPDEEGGKEEGEEVASGNDLERAFGDNGRGRQKITSNVNAKWEASKRQLQQLAAQRSWETGNPELTAEADEDIQDNKSGPAASGLDPSNIGLGEIEEKGDEGGMEAKPPMDVFKAVFADDNDDDDDEMEGTEELRASEGQSGVQATMQAPLLSPLQASKPGESLESFKPAFVPRKRSGDENGGTIAKEGGERKKKKKKDVRRGKGLLTFSVDDEAEGEEEEVVARTPKAGRPKAADLFN